MLNPDQANGFVAWFDTDSTVKYWELEILERVPLTDSTSKFVQVWKHEEWRNNYVHIPSEYRPSDIRNKYGIFLKGKDGNDQVVVDEEIVPFLCEDCGDDFYYPGCYQICNGPTYAWKVQQWIPVSEFGHDYQLSGASHEGEPFYEYMTNDVYTALTQETLLSDFIYHYAIPDFQALIPDNPVDFPEFANIYVKNITNSSETDYEDRNGNTITDPVFKAVRKAQGIWNNAVSEQAITDHLSWDVNGTNSLCVNNNIEYAMMLMNTHDADLDPTLTCDMQSYDPPSGGSWDEVWANCDYLYDNMEDYDFTDTLGITNFLNDWLDCVGDNDGGGSTGDNGGVPWGGIHELNLSYIDEGGVSSIFQKLSSELYNENGEFKPFSVKLDPGLYYAYATLDFTTEIIPDIVFELEEAAIFGVTYADMFDFTVFPVPHTEDWFSVNMQAQVNLRANYELYDFQGNKIHNAQYNLKQGHDEDHKVIPVDPIPQGLLIHRFVFEDGSVKTLTTMKQ